MNRSKEIQHFLPLCSNRPGRPHPTRSWCTVSSSRSSLACNRRWVGIKRMSQNQHLICQLNVHDMIFCKLRWSIFGNNYRWWSCEQFPGDDKVLQEDPPARQAPRHASIPPGQLVQHGVPRALGSHLWKNGFQIASILFNRVSNLLVDLGCIIYGCSTFEKLPNQNWTDG